MQLGSIIIYFVLGLALFLILNYFDRQEKENNAIHAILPIIYIIILAGIFSSIGYQEINHNLFMVVIMELLIRIYYVKSILKREDLMNSKFYFQIYGVAILGSYFLNQVFISKVDNIFPTPSEMRMGIWFLIVLFLYMVFKNHIHIEATEEKSTFISKRKEYALVQYARLKNEYHKEVKLKNKELVPLFYAIMIYENYKRPRFFRKLDCLTYRFTGKETKMGIMQIPSRSELGDIESIKLAIKKINQIDSSIKDSKQKVKDVLLEYYIDHNNYVSDVLDIYHEIVTFDKN